ncbi:protein EMBRYO SAC DEVELOPMENT ARREST 3, chloroplastic isoform X2 [Cinnamomum micranthum f. kanehirae]|uniref:Protein EMBRYO SAC DEVELOPMENT ARREST 3, chloroplastic isoform X2 n=1 Tax=Cinnamomum micranthum f. kanehirae TaxID=337451 RepID=A0A443PPG8_9MAGN|nr:protein EMBRYO SAC DEVELOPMENT ARREST 3, chloroplastic isoform X2 [Cinnamomum micranthum f. kanehirae]
MANLSLWSSLTAPSLLSLDSQSCLYPFHVPTPPNSREFRISAAKSGISSFIPVGKKCQTCGGQGAIECRGCKGTGKNKKNGNIFERWKCFDCQGFGLKSCPSCGKGGLTPEQRGER